jgi:hypothetical protein
VRGCRAFGSCCELHTKRGSALVALSCEPFVSSKNLRIANVGLPIVFDPLPCLFEKLDRIGWDNVA